MKKKNTIFPRLKNLSVGWKLTGGFLAVVMVAVLITGVGISGFREIRENLRLQKLSVEMVMSLGDARLNRVLFQYTGNQEYAEKNKMAVDKLRQGLQTLGEADLLAEGIKKRDTALRFFNQYREALNTFSEAQEQARLAREQIDISGLVELRNRLFLMAQAPSLAQEFALTAMKLTNNINMLIDSSENLVAHPDSAGLDRVLANIQEIDTLRSALPIDAPAIDAATVQALSARMTALGPLFRAFLASSDARAAASQTLSNVSAELRSSITTIFFYQQQQSGETVSRARLIMVIAALAGVCFALLISVWITRNITRPLRETLHAARRISDGDLTHLITSDRGDEPGLLMQAVGVMNENLRRIIVDVRGGVERVARASTEIAAGNASLSARTEAQSAAVVQTAASMEQLTSTVRQTAGNAQEASRLAQQASDNAAQGGDIVAEVVTTMKDISESSHRISEIIGVINDIAFQTNILALNAAVEAARAGEKGRGFAVVATEVRSLAQRSSLAAREIAELINQSGDKVAAGSRLVSNAGESMSGIVSSVMTVREIMAEIAVASQEQSKGIQQISLSMSEMDSTTQQNAALVEQSSAAAKSLEEQALQLEAAVAVFRMNVPS